MVTDKAIKLIEDLKRELAREFELLTSGQLQALGETRETKARLMRDVETELRTGIEPFSKDAISHGMRDIATLAKRNEAHFMAAKSGLKSLIDRFQAYGADAAIGTYDQTGASVSFQRGSGGYVKKV